MNNLAIKEPTGRRWSMRRNREEFMIPPMPGPSTEERLAELERKIVSFENRIKP